jgi:hypothetical protein
VRHETDFVVNAEKSMRQGNLVVLFALLMTACSREDGVPILMRIPWAPVAVDDTATTQEKVPVDIDVLANDTDFNSDSLTVTAVSAASYGTVSINSEKTVRYSPTVPFPGSDIDDTFTYTVSDGLDGTDTGLVTVSIHRTPGVPVAVDDVVTTTDIAPVDIDVLANDSDPNGNPLTVTAVSAASYGTVSINPDGTVRYNPSVPIPGSGCDDAFTYTVSDGLDGEDSALVTVSVHRAPRAPVAVDDTAVTVTGVPVDIDVLANDSDPNGNPLTVTAISAASYGTVSINPDGTVRYNSTLPYPGFGIQDTFTYTVSDGLDGVGSALVTVSFLQRCSRVSVATGGAQANDGGWPEAISADGRYVAFGSYSTNLVANDTNNYGDIFIRDRQTGETTRVSVDSSGNQAMGGHSSSASLTPDGRYVAFSSEASNLVAGDTNGARDIFVHDRQTGETTRVSVATGGAQANSGSSSDCPSLSADGRYVAFHSSASNLVAGDTNLNADVFVHDRLTGETTRVSVASDGTQANWSSSLGSLSADGRYVAFVSGATNLIADDTNGYDDVFVHDRQTRETTRVSVDSSGAQVAGYLGGGPSISADGRYVIFNSFASTLVADDTNGVGDGFIHDRLTGETTRVTVATGGAQATGQSTADSISADGRYVSFQSHATNLVSGDTNGDVDIFVRDRQAGVTLRVSVTVDGAQSFGGWSWNSVISADGRYVAFQSWVPTLVPNDTNSEWDAFVVPNPPPP